MRDFLKKFLRQDGDQTSQLTKVYRQTFLSTPAQDFQTDAVQLAWNGWRVQSVATALGWFGIPELVVVYQRDGGAVLP